MSETVSRSPFQFFVLVFIVTLPFLGLGAVGVQVLPGIPLSALAVVAPALAAGILLFRASGAAGVMALLKRSFDLGGARIMLWYVPVVLLTPAIAIACFFVLRGQGVAVPAPEFSALPTVALLALFFVSALGEELGWSGYALDPLQRRFGALGGGLILGGVWALWHYVPLLQVGRGVEYIAWWSLGTLSMRVVMVWLYNSTARSVFAMAMFHAVSNLAWQLFPVQGSFFDPRLHALLMTAVAIVAVAVFHLGRADSASSAHREADQPAL